MTAEGIENAASFSLLRDLGCDVAQGFYIGRPKPAAEIVQERLPNPELRSLPALASGNRPSAHGRGRIRPFTGRQRLAKDSLSAT